ncbi:hypothetical protein MYP_1010 [Sporocytophaga myxococcoides]|uniref:Alpha-1,2-fucosyltransferase n=2 Tax=Sporocytophaga myxococcoides TaxID=153721 RepID=A0A098LBK2_9BACT|nr:hypothetical protein MYP_1010 [Sporocytophaga myxococcoides]
MFQYAAAKGLAEMKKVPLKLDITDFLTHYNLRNFELDKFNISSEVALEKEMLYYKCNSKSYPFNLYLKVLKKIKGVKYQMEPHFHYWDEIKGLPKSSYLEGYWQSEKYFSGIENIIREEFTLKEGLSEERIGLLKEISNSNSVSIHVRRGDYISNPEANKVHGICSTNYYINACNYIIRNINAPKFYVFSDDIEYVKKSGIFGRLNDVFFVKALENEKRNDVEEMFLMSSCAHNIIANSSFSWWGAWLNGNAEKIVIAPKVWFADSTINTKDIIPERWIKL